eukprot:jgi/Mesen1/9886/ME000070S09178
MDLLNGSRTPGPSSCGALSGEAVERLKESEGFAYSRPAKRPAGVAGAELATSAAADWRRIRERLSGGGVPACKGHGDPCVARVVKKGGLNNGRTFYVCARAQGPADNPEARCDHFEWAVARSKRARQQALP